MFLHELELGVGEKIINDGEFYVTGMNFSRERNTLTFAENSFFAEQALNNENISCIIIREEILKMIPKNYGVIVCTDPRGKFYSIHNNFRQNEIYDEMVQSYIDSSSYIDPTAIISDYNVKIGKNVYIGAFVKIYESVVIGDETRIHTGCTIGGEGFQFPRCASGMPVKCEHYGKVEIGNNVEILEHTNIAKGVFYNEVTRIGDNTKIDTMCHIAHSVHIGEKTLVAAKAMIAGSAHIGNGVWIGPMASVSNLVKVNDNARVLLGAVVTRDVKEGEEVSGNFAVPHKKQIENIKKIIM